MTTTGEPSHLEVAGPSPNAAVSIVVVNYGSHELLEQNLTNFGPDADIVVVDNFHSSAERLAVEEICDRYGWNLISVATNSGFGSAVNLGVRYASGAGAQVVLLINPDARITQDGVDELVGECLRDPKVLVGPRIVRSDGTTWFQGGRVVAAEGRTRMVDLTVAQWPDSWLTGACLAIPVEFWLTIGGFDDDYFMYWEDVDLSQKWRDAGGRLEVRGDVEVVHLIGGTQSQGAHGKSALYYRYNCRNRLIFAAKHLEAPELRIWLRGTLPYARSVVLRGGRRQFLRHPFMPVLAAARGSIEGYRAARRRLRELR